MKESSLVFTSLEFEKLNLDSHYNNFELDALGSIFSQSSVPYTNFKKIKINFIYLFIYLLSFLWGYNIL